MDARERFEAERSAAVGKVLTLPNQQAD